MGKDCIFCKIVSGELPSHKVWEDNDFFAFLDINPLNPGHTLLIPKKHVRWVNNYEPFCNYWETARTLSKSIKKTLNPLLVAYVVYGLEVPHAHIHLIPKFEGDEHPIGPDPNKKYTYKEGEVDAVAKTIRKELS